ncbi:MAG: sporulation regulator WhiA, partial [Clostridiales bacterium]|nr:sporulation regulator WhiA [Clostridiales bacterium]
MSFSSDTKEELIRLPLDKSCCILHELGAITQTSASLSLQGGDSFQITYQVENTPLARRIFLLLRRGFSIVPNLHFIQHPRFKNRKT